MNPRCEHPGCGRQLFGRLLHCFVHGDHVDSGAIPFLETVLDTDRIEGTGRFAGRPERPARHCIECGKLLVGKTAVRCMPCSNRHTARTRRVG